MLQLGHHRGWVAMGSINNRAVSRNLSIARSAVVSAAERQAGRVIRLETWEHTQLRACTVM